MLNSLVGFLRYKEIEGLPIDSPERLESHQRLMLKKPILRSVHRDFYKSLEPTLSALQEGPKVEIGSSGWSFLEDFVPDVMKSDILMAPDIHLCMSGLNLPFKESSISALFLTNCLHHLPDTKHFFSEVERVLKPGGHLLMVEPHYSIFMAFIWKHFHHEGFRIDGPWTFESTGPVSSSNLALPWIIFNRDIKIFEEENKTLKLICRKTHTGFAYLLTGGLSYRSIIPHFSYPLVKLVDKILSAFTGGMTDGFETFVIQKQ